MYSRILAATVAATLGISGIAAAAATNSAAAATNPPVDGAEPVTAKDKETLLGYTDAQADARLLGDASYFSLFLKNDGTVRGSDCEGRLAVGGNFINGTENPFYENYQIGNGIYNYGDKFGSNVDEKLQGIADGIVMGDLLGVGFNFGWKPYESAKRYEWSGSYDTHRIFVVNQDSFVSSGKNKSEKINLNDEIGSKLYYTAEKNEIIDFDAEFTYLKGVADKLDEQPTVKGGTEISGNTIYFSCTDTGAYDKYAAENEDNAYVKAGYIFFNINEADLTYAKEIRVNVPKDKYVVINVVDNHDDGEVTTYELATLNDATYNGTKPVFYYNNKQLENNSPETSKLLYNFGSDVTKLHIVNNLLGTAFAPYADVDSKDPSENYNDGWGHVSGNVIAQSFDGVTEFGYITFDGPAVKINKPSEPDPSETDPSETDPSETDPSETDPSETDPSETDPSETDPSETDPSETDPSETDPSETDPSETDPSETDPSETDPSETDPSETDPSETDPSETDPSETDPSETDPSETDPSETDPSETDPSETDPSETDPSETDPVDSDQPTESVEDYYDAKELIEKSQKVIDDYSENGIKNDEEYKEVKDVADEIEEVLANENVKEEDAAVLKSNLEVISGILGDYESKDKPDDNDVATDDDNKKPADSTDDNNVGAADDDKAPDTGALPAAASAALLVAAAAFAVSKKK